MFPATVTPADGKWYHVEHRFEGNTEWIKVTPTDDTSSISVKCYFCGEAITTPTILYVPFGREYEPCCVNCDQWSRDNSLL